MARGFAAPALAAVATALASYFDGPILWFSKYDAWASEAASSSAKGVYYSESPDLEISTASEGDFLLVISPKPGRELDDKWLTTWLQNETNWLRKAFFRHGALAFRGFNIGGSVGFERVAMAVSHDLEEEYLGTSPRNQINGTRFVHSAADFPPHRTIPIHLEMSFKDMPPRIQLFYGERADQMWGGESPLVDFAGVWESLGQQLQEKLNNSRIQYYRRYDDCTSPSFLSKTVDFLTTRCWQDMFKTDNRTEVAETCEDENFDCVWDHAGTLTIMNTQPWIRKHDVTGTPIFFNHFNVLQPDSMILDYQRTAVVWGAPQGWWPMMMAGFYGLRLSVLRLFLSDFELGQNVAFEGGIPLQTHEIMEMKRAIWQNIIQKHWQAEDIVLLDNRRVGHGREMFAGLAEDRRVLTAWSDEYPAW